MNAPQKQIVELTDANFDAETASGLTLVDFGAPWCGACKAIEPTLERLVEERGDRVRFARLDVDENTAMAARYRVLGLPTVILFRDGEAVEALVGAHPKRAFDALLDRHEPA